MKNSTLELQKYSQRINKVYGGRYKGSIILKENYLLNVFKYIYLNPVRAGICSRAEDYLYSTYYNGKNRMPLPFELTTIIDEKLYSCERINKWINCQFKENENLSLSKGLKKSTFSYIKENSSGKFIAPPVIL